MQHERVEAILFDLDGTLVRLRQSPRGRLARRFWSATEIPIHCGMVLFDSLGLDRRLRSWTDRARRLKGVSATGELRPVDHARETVAGLAQRFRLGVVTHRGAGDAAEFLQRSRLAEHFSAVVTRGDVWLPKPHPAGVRRALMQLGVAARHALVIGDTAADMRAARRSGALAIGVTTGFGTADELDRAGAQLVLGSVAELPSVLDSACLERVRPLL